MEHTESRNSGETVLLQNNLLGTVAAENPRSGQGDDRVLCDCQNKLRAKV